MHGEVDGDLTSATEGTHRMRREVTDHIIDPAEFGKLAELVVQRLQQMLIEVDSRPLTRHRVPEKVSAALRRQSVPVQPSDPRAVVIEAMEMMLSRSLFTAHPRFLGYICPAADPMGIIAEALVAAVNANAASAMMAPIGHELEQTVIRWLAQILGLPDDADGILVSGGNESNLLGILAAREHQTPWPIRATGFNHPDAVPLYVYATAEVHNGLQKAVEIAGLGTQALRMVPIDRQGRMDVRALRKTIEADRRTGGLPICIVGTAGTVATGAIDPISAIVDLAAEERLWVHIDGSYGAGAALLPDAPADIRAISKVDSVSWDPHKWLRVPFEAGCVLLRQAGSLRKLFGIRPTYYDSGGFDDVVHYYEKGPQNSRQLRALKVWMSLVQHGTSGHAALIARDLDLARAFFEAVQRAPRLEALTCNLSIVTFRYVPDVLRDSPLSGTRQGLLNEVNRLILHCIQEGGDTYLSNAMIDEGFWLRACFVNYKTQPADLARVIDLVERTGSELEAKAARRASC